MTFLVVDKSEDIRDRIKNLILEKYKSAEVYESKSNEEAITLATEIQPKLLITDLDLIDGSGLSLISFASRLFPETMNIVFTNHNTVKFKYISLKIGADYFLSKTNDFLKIKKIVNQIN